MGDLISKEAVLSLPREKIRNFYGEVIKEAVDVELIEGVRSWIPVSERLPEEYKNVLVYDKCEGILTAYRIKDEWGMDYGFAEMEYYSDDVIAWMPFPTPYKEEVEE